RAGDVSGPRQPGRGRGTGGARARARQRAPARARGRARPSPPAPGLSRARAPTSVAANRLRLPARVRAGAGGRHAAVGRRPPRHARRARAGGDRGAPAPCLVSARRGAALARARALAPATRGHALVIPRTHVADLLTIERDDLHAVATAAQRLVQRVKERLGADGVNLVNSCGAVAWQTVFHFHVHVIPRYEGDPLRL